jgi:hypothetical protein
MGYVYTQSFSHTPRVEARDTPIRAIRIIPPRLLEIYDLAHLYCISNATSSLKKHDIRTHATR